MSEFFGKYRGQVVNNVDPLGEGRVQVSCEAVLGKSAAWALPCFPCGDAGLALSSLPPAGAGVWVEFEAGDPSLPIWSGCFFGPGYAPTGKVKIESPATLELSAAMVEVNAGMARFSGVVQCSTLIANSVVASSYTPGAGNIW